MSDIDVMSGLTDVKVIEIYNPYNPADRIAFAHVKNARAFLRVMNTIGFYQAKKAFEAVFYG